MNKDILQAIMLAGEIPKNMQTTDNLVTEISSESTDKQYPSAKAVYEAIPRGMELIASGSGADITSILINRDSQSKSFQLKKVLIMSNAAGSGYYMIALNGDNEAKPYASDNIQLSTSSKSLKHIIECEKTRILFSGNVSGGGGFQYLRIYPVYTYNQTLTNYIQSIKIKTYGTFTSIDYEIWGMRA